MKAYYQDDQVTIYHGDAREVLQELDLEGEVSVITDPVWPNSTPDIVGHEDPTGLFSEVCKLLEGKIDRIAVHLGCDSDPRFLQAVPSSLKFIRSCNLEYARPHYKGRILYTGDTAYLFGEPTKSRKGRHLIPGRFVDSSSDGKQTDHPCPRKLGHVKWLVRWFGEGVVLDPFMGSGTTLRAAKDLGLKSIGIEIEEKYCEVAVKRMAQGVLFGIPEEEK